MWILSQWKDLITKAERIRIEQEDASSEWLVISNAYDTLGRYDSEERAKEIIQDIYLALKAGNHCYEMPKE